MEQESHSPTIRIKMNNDQLNINGDIPRWSDVLFHPFKLLHNDVNDKQHYACDEFLNDYKSNKIFIESITRWCEFGIPVYSMYYRYMDNNTMCLKYSKFSRVNRKQESELFKIYNELQGDNRNE